MSLANLIRKRETVAPANANPAKAANDEQSKAGTLARLATLALANSKEEESTTPDPQAEARRERVLRMLQDSPGIAYAVVTDTEVDPDNVILALAIRGRATCELLVPRAKWDGVLFIDLLEKHCGVIH